MDENRITVYDDHGNSQSYEILFTYSDEASGKDYVFYYDEGDQVFISRYDEKGHLYPIEDAAEWEFVEEVFASYMNEEEDEEDDKCKDCVCEDDDCVIDCERCDKKR